jgi:hypothetical protein
MGIPSTVFSGKDCDAITLQDLRQLALRHPNGENAGREMDRKWRKIHKQAQKPGGLTGLKYV